MTSRPLKTTTKNIVNAKQAFSVPNNNSENDNTPKISDKDSENYKNPTENFIEIIYGSGRNIPLNPNSYTIHIKKYFASKLKEIYEEDFLEYSMGVINKDFLDNLHEGVLGNNKKGNIFNSKHNNNNKSFGANRNQTSNNSTGNSNKISHTKEEKMKMEAKESQLQELASEFRKTIHFSRAGPQEVENYETNQLSVKAKDQKGKLSRNNSYNERNETKQLLNLTHSEAMDFMILVNNIKPSDKKKAAKKSNKDHGNQSEYESEYENDENKPPFISEWVKNFDLIEENGALLGLSWSKNSDKISDLLIESVKNNKNFTRTSNKFILALTTYSNVTNEVKEVIPLILDPPDEISDTTGDWLKFFNRKKLKDFGSRPNNDNSGNNKGGFGGNSLGVEDGLKPRTSMMMRPKSSTVKR